MPTPSSSTVTSTAFSVRRATTVTVPPYGENLTRSRRAPRDLAQLVGVGLRGERGLREIEHEPVAVPLGSWTPPTTSETTRADIGRREVDLQVAVSTRATVSSWSTIAVSRSDSDAM